MSICKRKHLDPYAIQYTKIHSKQIKNQKSVRPKTITLLEENIGENDCDIGFGNEFLGRTPEAQANETTQNVKTSA